MSEQIPGANPRIAHIHNDTKSTQASTLAMTDGIFVKTRAKGKALWVASRTDERFLVFHGEWVAAQHILWQAQIKPPDIAGVG